MAAITPGVLLKLLQSMNSDAKPLGEHRSAVLQVIGIIPAPPSAGADSGDYLWPSHGFYLQLSDSVHSTYVSLSDVDADNVVSNRPQLGQLVHVDRLRFAIPVPFATGLRLIPSPRSHPFLGLPEPLIAISTPSHAPGFVIQPVSPSAAAESVMRRPIFVPKENVAPAPTNSTSDSTSSVSKAKRRFSSPAHRHSSPAPTKTSSRPASPTVSGKAGSRAPSPVPSKCEVPSLVAAREENRRVVKEPAIVVPSRYRQPSPTARKVVSSPMGRRSSGSPGGRRLSGGLKLSPALAEGGGKRKVGSTVAGISRVSDSLVASGRAVRKNWEDMPLNSDSTSNEKTNSRSKSHANDQAILKSQLIEEKLYTEKKSNDNRQRRSNKLDALIMDNRSCTTPKFIVDDNKWIDGNIPLDGLSQNLIRLGKDALNRRNAAAIAAAEALEEALSTESILRSLSMFCNLCSSPNTGNPLPTINTFLNIYDDTVKGTSMAASLAATRTGKTPVDALSINQAKSAKLWVEAALSMDLEVAKLASCISDGHPHLSFSERVKLPTGDFSCSADMGKPGRHLYEALELADALRHEMQTWFLKFVEEAVSAGFGVFGENRSGDMENTKEKEKSGVAAALCHLKRVSDWLDVVGKKPDGELFVEKIEQLKRKICNFVITQVGSSFDSAVSLGKH